MTDHSDLQFPDTLKYDEEHEWITKISPYRIGVSDFAQEQLGDLTFVELPEVGAVLAKGDEFGTLESTKSVSPLYSPVSGTVVAVNEDLADDPGLVNTDPYGDGWIIEIDPRDAGELESLMEADEYKAQIEEGGD